MRDYRTRVARGQIEKMKKKKNNQAKKEPAARKQNIPRKLDKMGNSKLERQKLHFSARETPEHRSAHLAIKLLKARGYRGAIRAFAITDAYASRRRRKSRVACVVRSLKLTRIVFKTHGASFEEAIDSQRVIFSRYFAADSAL